MKDLQQNQGRIQYPTERPVGDILKDLEDRGLLPLARLAAERCGVSLVEALGRCRYPRIVKARHTVIRAVALMVHPVESKAWNMSYPELGRLFGLDHATIMAAAPRPRRPGEQLHLSRDESRARPKRQDVIKALARTTGIPRHEIDSAIREGRTVEELLTGCA